MVIILVIKRLNSIGKLSTMRFTLLVCTLWAASAAEQRYSYDGFKAYLLTPSTSEHIKQLQSFSENEDVHLWSRIGGINDQVSIIVAPKLQDKFVKMMRTHKIDYNVLVDNVERVLENERIQQSRYGRIPNGTINFTAYHRYATIQAYLYELARNYPDIVKVKTIGKTSENRDLTAIVIGSGSKYNKNILIDGGIHAREWIAPAFVTYIIHQLVENESNRYMIEDVTWHIIPVLNPDGYEYSHYRKRFWRKTRSCRNGFCNGVDGNRNFDIHWMEAASDSQDEFSETYAGPHPFSEPETAAYSDYALSLNTINLYLTFHSYGQFILHPWGWTYSPLNNKSKLQELINLGSKVREAIYDVYGTQFKVASASTFGEASGGSDDWMFAVAGADLSYTIELPPHHDHGSLSNFDLPSEKIPNVCQETWEGVIVFYNHIMK